MAIPRPIVPRLNFGGEIVHTLNVRKETIKSVQSPLNAISISSRPVEDMHGELNVAMCIESMDLLYVLYACVESMY